MKNIHILPTDKPSRLLQFEGELVFTKGYNTNCFTNRNQNIYITSDEEIKEGDWCLDEDGLKKCTAHAGAMNHYYQKIILTTDQDLIKDGVQAIDDEFLEWFVKNPSCEEVEVEYGDDGNGYQIIQKEEPKKKHIVIIVGDKVNEEPKQETLEEAYNKIYKSIDFTEFDFTSFAIGAKWQEQQTIEEVFEWLTTNNYLTDLKETLINNFKNK
jgi:hypothetical protein